MFACNSKVKNVQELNEQELRAGITGTKASWHEQYKNSAYIFVGTSPRHVFMYPLCSLPVPCPNSYCPITCLFLFLSFFFCRDCFCLCFFAGITGGLDFGLTEGDILAVFSQYVSCGFSRNEGNLMIQNSLLPADLHHSLIRSLQLLQIWRNCGSQSCA